MSGQSQLEIQSDYSVRQGHEDIKSPPQLEPTPVKSQLKSNSQSSLKSLFRVSIVLGLIMSLTVIVGGIFVVTGQTQVKTTRDSDTKENQTHPAMNNRSVPHSYNASQQSAVISQVNTSHIQSQLPYNNKLTQGLTDKVSPRVKRGWGSLKLLAKGIKTATVIAPVVPIIKELATPVIPNIYNPTVIEQTLYNT